VDVAQLRNGFRAEMQGEEALLRGQSLKMEFQAEDTA
jgi:hypothetical protein